MRRSETAVRDERMTSHLGCRNVTELLEETTRVSTATAGRWQRAAKAVRPQVSDLTGELLASDFPSVRAAMVDGVIGVDGILAITGPLQETAPRVSTEARHAAADVVVAEARGEGPDGAPPACAAVLAIHARTWSIALDQDGAEPRERAAVRKRSFVLGTATPHGVPARGMLLPTIGGHAPTLVVSVAESDLASGTGYAHADGCAQPVSGAVARHIACGGVIQRIVTRSNGRIVAIGTEERVFNRHQRRTIALRDGGCVIPGCATPAGWCEIHHVNEHARGGPTHTDNGVLLCWYHHRFLERIGWQIRMNAGTPEVKAPPWHGTDRRWRPVTTSPMRLKNLVRRT